MKIAVIGLGLIGGSLARQFKKNTPHTVLGYDISEEVMLKAELLGAIDERLDLSSPVDADVVFAALCPGAAIEVMERICPLLKPGAIVADTAGVKRDIVKKMGELSEKYPEISFVGVHPMAGREFSGISHSTANLFEHAYIIITPVCAEIEAAEKVKDLFTEAVCQGITMASAEEHDKIIAYTSQLAHVVSSAYMQNPVAENYFGFSAGSFRDMTRVAKLSPDMWTELFGLNRDNLIPCIDDIIFRLTSFRKAIASGDDGALHAMLERGNELKERAEKTRRERKND